MKINNTNVSTYHARQFNFSYDHNAVSNASQWAEGSALPYLADNHIGFQRFTVTLLMKNTNRKSIRKDCSDILAALLEPVTLELDGFDNKFKAVLISHKETERSLNKYHLLELSFQGYEFGTDVTGTGTGSATVNNPGNIDSPASIVVTPSSDGDIVLEGTRETITILNCTANLEVTIDGMTGLVTEDGTSKMSDVEMWELPVMEPGTNTVYCSDESATVTVTVRPLYM